MSMFNKVKSSPVRVVLIVFLSVVFISISFFVGLFSRFVNDFYLSPSNEIVTMKKGGTFDHTVVELVTKKLEENNISYEIYENDEGVRDSAICVSGYNVKPASKILKEMNIDAILHNGEYFTDYSAKKEIFYQPWFQWFN